MAIGDTVQAGLMRIDTSAYERAGQANANANMAFGNALNQVAKGFIEGREKKARSEEMTGYLMNQGVSEKDAKAISKNPFLQKEYQRKKGAEQQMEIEKGRLSAQAAALRSSEKIAGDKAAQIQSERDLIRADADELKQAKGDFLGKFYSSVPTGELNEAGQEEVANFQAFAAPEDPRTNPFIQETLQNPEFQQTEPVMDMTGNRFAQQFAGDSPEVQQLVLNFMQARQKDAPSISRVVNMEDGQGGFQQVGVDSAGNPIRSFGPPKPSGMYRTPEEARKEKILVGRTEDAMKSVKSYVEGSSLAIKQAAQANLALKNIPNTTGGITSFVNDMKVLAESVGIDLPEKYTEDMKDIGLFRQLTGQFLFDAMSNTKGSITEREMGLFRQISPDIDNSKAANEAMLGLYVKAGERAKDRRNLIRGLQEKDVDPREIERAIEKFDEENSLMDDIQALAPQSEQQSKELQTFRLGQKQVKGQIVGVRPDGLNIIKTADGKLFIQPAQ